MSKHISDEDLDRQIRQMLKNAAPDEAFVNEIADSPTLLWQIRHNIDQHEQTAKQPWPPVNKFRRWLLAAVPVAAAAALVFGFVFLRQSNEPAPVASLTPNQPDVQKKAEAIKPPATDIAPTVAEPVQIVEKRARRRAGTTHNTIAVRKSAGGQKPTSAANGPTEPKAEVKTDFIALSYARDPDSGQIVRVKVPSSMMVSLGLVASVEKPTDLVDAEVLVGDDGLTRAIRFIRK
jgi:hypothetical protein